MVVFCSYPSRWKTYSYC
uniref:Uncharacterized protein n=1 Tax=Arundo donax TaxID=35708 RepID=A0A0A8XTL7_ARUDO